MESDSPPESLLNYDPALSLRCRLARELARSLRESRPWLASLVTHAALFITLSYWILPLATPGALKEITLSTAIDEAPIGTVPPVEAEIVSAAPSAKADSRVQIDDLPDPSQPVVVLDSKLLEQNLLSPKESLSSSMATAADTTLARPENDKAIQPRSTDDALSEVGTVHQAVDVVTGEIAGQMDRGDTIVVWLFDASISLVGDRPLLAGRLEEFFRSIRGFNETRSEAEREHDLMHAAVAYGAATREMVPPTRFGAKVVSALQEVPIDVTGLENVMGAIQETVLYYRGKKQRRDRMLIIVWTDESGDDTPLLEETIALCRKGRASVHVVGPSAVFGAEQGTHHWVDPPTGHEFLLPVKRGPDTSLPERILLPYWFEHSLPPWGQDGAQVARNVPWYGGAYREGLLSGVGPYALTRLCMQTGGTYTLYDREADRSPFRLEAMRPYLPSYDSPAEYLASLEDYPLRQAVSNAVALSIQHQRALLPPALRCIARRSNRYPFEVHGSGYIHPAEFRLRLAEFLIAEQLRSAQSYAVVERALREFDDRRKVSMNSEYGREESPRWRAWHDLTKGRLLAVSVRYEEYAAVCELIKNNMGLLRPETNSIRFHPSSELRLSHSAPRAEEARRLLQRCLKEHADTPWAYLAQWELDNELGVMLQEEFIPPPSPSLPSLPGPPSPPAPTYTFPRL